MAPEPIAFIFKYGFFYSFPLFIIKLMGNDHIYDVAIIGAGPAGSTLARLVGKCRNVLLIDPRDFSCPADEISEKCCGGLLAPDAQEMLSRLGLGLPREVLVGPQLFVVNAIDLDTGSERYYPRHYINIDRRRFDKWLVSLIPENVKARFGQRLVSYERRGDFYELKILNGEGVIIERAKMVVGADGAASCVRRIAYGDSGKITKYVAVQEEFECGEMPPHFTSIFCTAITDFYSWIIPKEGILLVGSALKAGPEVEARFSLLKSKLQKRGIELGKPINKTAATLLRPRHIFDLCLGKKGPRGNKLLGTALIGEAAGFISPSSAEGISFALGSASALATALLDNPQNPVRQYRKEVQRLVFSIAVKNLKSPFIYNPFLRRIMMASGISSMNVINTAKPSNRPANVN